MLATTAIMSAVIFRTSGRKVTTLGAAWRAFRGIHSASCVQGHPFSSMHSAACIGAAHSVAYIQWHTLIVWSPQVCVPERDLDYIFRLDVKSGELKSWSLSKKEWGPVW